ncbi:cobalt-zinc-cadmium resistance protein [Roseateles saccharophilus]|uniref:cobalt-zinc-cadmium resistance protein n=1 Tax=Roseateles saccharophilus TaxID=304 RepID=UPI00104DF9DB|nr:cobalt-zinc-cadmium resistance protein [Roseateles saccharophilus]MBL8278678.1 cobalt-zinc-cadmium resistance protein [Roseateles sp.]MDG0835854.1 cobalt-zinc-cadmium resistance protein [Roseateles saccharophilus]
MRRVIVYLLLIVLPLQFTWVAASGYCAHETGVAAEHFGHHDHKHSGTAHATEQSKAGSMTHADCDMCHFGFSLPSLGVLATLEAPLTQFRSFEPLEPPSHIPALPERPARECAA